MKSNVYFVKVDSGGIEKRVFALKKLLEEVCPFSMYKKEEIIPVKITIGDSSCIYQVSPELVKVVLDQIKGKGAKPFIFDTSVIYKGQRQNAVDHLNLAQIKGFSHSNIGAPFVIADGLLGQDGKDYALGSKHIDKIKIPSFMGMLDSLIVLSHATGHIVSGYAGAIKNVAMGMSCRATKQVQHSSLKPSVIENKCISCGLCIGVCPVKAISFKGEKAFIDEKACLGCGECLCACKFDAISINWKEDAHIFCKRLAETAHFILSKFKNKFFVNFAFDITKECDCISAKDEKMISENIGILASSDIVSLDKATADLVRGRKITDLFIRTQDVYEGMLEYAAQEGLGNLEYNLIEL